MNRDGLCQGEIALRERIRVRVNAPEGPVRPLGRKSGPNPERVGSGTGDHKGRPYRTAPSHSLSMASSLSIISSTSSEVMDRGGEIQIGRPRANAG